MEPNKIQKLIKRHKIQKLIKRLYKIFSVYNADGVMGCTYCYSPTEIDYYSETPLHAITVDKATSLLYETGDHWNSEEAYKHFLPRMLEIMGPQFKVEDMYTGHLFETLLYHNFKSWPEKERKVVIEYLIEIKPFINFYDDEDQEDWDKGMVNIGDA
ncbi:MAG: hypothetical protein ACMUJM_24580 [bacterium]